MSEYDLLQNKLYKCKNTELVDIKRDEIVDIEDISINEKLNSKERILQYIKKVKNPYILKTNDTLVKITFNTPNVDFSHCMSNIIKKSFMQG